MILITVLVGTSSFASIAAIAVTIGAKIAIGLLSVTAAVLSALQTFFKFSERSEKHRHCGALYGAIERELEALLAAEPHPIDPLYLASLREKLHRLSEDAPHVPGRVFLENKQSLRAEARRDNALAMSS